MPRRSPFTTLCGQLAKLNRPQRADLHIHSTASDGEFTPAQVIAIARQSRLRAIAITDHDTLAGAREAQAICGDQIELVPAVEISAEYAGREVHLLGYFIRLDHRELNLRLARLCEGRRERFRDFIAQLAKYGSHIPLDRVKLVEEIPASLGRRHVAALLTACGIATSRTEAFHRFLGPIAGRVQPKLLIPVEEAISLIVAAGGIASLAHPTSELNDGDFHALKTYGLGALEVEYPWSKRSRMERLRETAIRFGFALSGGSDCHGPQPKHRCIGSCGIGLDELDRLRNLCGQGSSITKVF
jgi:predicted metal-dependent phosphoesterase TrpH